MNNYVKASRKEIEKFIVNTFKDTHNTQLLLEELDKAFYKAEIKEGFKVIGYNNSDYINGEIDPSLDIITDMGIVPTIYDRVGTKKKTLSNQDTYKSLEMIFLDDFLL